MPFTPLQLLSLAQLACQLGQPLADNTIGPGWPYRAIYIIPITRCPVRKIFPLCSIHVAAWLSSFAIRFTWSPVCVDWNRVIVPVEGLCIPVQPDPNLFQWWCFLIHEIQDKLVFFSTVYLHQTSTQWLAVLLSVDPRLDGTTHQVTVAVKPRPTIGTRFTWKRVKSWKSWCWRIID